MKSLGVNIALNSAKGTYLRIMIIQGYGVKLIRLNREYLELLRTMRNSESVRQYMEYREEITPEMQEAWFQKIDSEKDAYFIIFHNEKPVGMINGSDIDWDKKETRSGGIFIWEEEFLKSDLPLRASLLLTDVSLLLGMERTYAKILRENESAIRFNTLLGYEILPGQELNQNQEYVLEKANYLRKTKKVREMLLKLFPGPIETLITDRNHVASQNAIRRYAHLGELEKQQLKLMIL